MVLTREQVEHVADLAKLGLTEEELEAYRKQLSAILEYAAILERLDTDAIPPTATVLRSRSVMRDDRPAPSLQQADALANAPSTAESYFRVKGILEEPRAKEATSDDSSPSEG
jgi:aspartyl-tRNA(Asn)/glutamyl-tRNA(Gln) amidotransferase subunit C